MRWHCKATVPAVQASVEVEISAIVEAHNVEQALLRFDEVLTMTRQATTWNTTSCWQM